VSRLLPDPERDPRLGEALRRLDDDAWARDDDDELSRRILLAARGRLARLHNPPEPWWEWTAAWARVVIPLGAAASIAAAAILVSERGSVDPAWSDADSVTVSGAMLSAAALPAGEAQVTDQLLVPASEEWLLNGALDR
jgi:hypothetical protein